MGATLPDSNSYQPLQLQLKDMLQETDYAKWFGYGRSGSLWQKDAAVKLIRRGGFETTVDQILFANGGQNAIAAVLASLFKPGDRIGADQHTYPGLKTVAAMFGIQIVPIKSEGHVMSSEAFEYACKNEHIKGVYLIPDYHNSTACCMPVANRQMIAAIAKKYKQFIIEDATYHLHHKQPFPAVAAFASEQTIHIASLSKSISPGLRLAYVSVPDQLKDLISKALYNLNISVSPLLAELAARTIVSNQLEDLLEGHRQQTTRRNQVVHQYLADYTYLGAETGSFHWLLLPGEITGAQFEALASQQGIQVYAAERFVVGNSCPERAVRFAVCAPETLEELERGLRIMKKLLNRLT